MIVGDKVVIDFNKSGVVIELEDGAVKLVKLDENNLWYRPKHVQIETE